MRKFNPARFQYTDIVSYASHYDWQFPDLFHNTTMKHNKEQPNPNNDFTLNIFVKIVHLVHVASFVFNTS